ncbi:hypothetical protein EGR_00922 [Echinococcus granulosus]|uniref:Uncharacterized protein n=1 Tax=Echinococcus granulosus TaxID=6210 RepID=W6USU5_ECHGR|nr:hypothetical protein EGR_00922 [Echinococcus granulosus]EUB64378.1 hypothetical protein EGR_00922 [Echinococcus granulosus]
MIALKISGLQHLSDAPKRFQDIKEIITFLMKQNRIIPNLMPSLISGNFHPKCDAGCAAKRLSVPNTSALDFIPNVEFSPNPAIVCLIWKGGDELNVLGVQCAPCGTTQLHSVVVMRNKTKNRHFYNFISSIIGRKYHKTDRNASCSGSEAIYECNFSLVEFTVYIFLYMQKLHVCPYTCGHVITCLNLITYICMSIYGWNVFWTIKLNKYMFMHILVHDLFIIFLYMHAYTCARMHFGLIEI